MNKNKIRYYKNKDEAKNSLKKGEKIFYDRGLNKFYVIKSSFIEDILRKINIKFVK